LREKRKNFTCGAEGRTGMRAVRELVESVGPEEGCCVNKGERQKCETKESIKREVRNEIIKK
jgi:hypothetical protein